MSERLRNRLSELSTQLDRLPETEDPPSTTLRILGRNQREQDWQRLLFHYLSSDAPHGLGTAFQDHLLTALAKRDDLEFSFSRLDLDNIQVEREVVTTEGWRPDAVVWADNDWFICWEVKVNASEAAGQTREYVQADSFQSINLDKQAVPNTGDHYVYLAPETAPPPDAEEFESITWEWVASEIASFVHDGFGKYPSRTTSQLQEFVDTIQHELTMTEHQENQREKAELYLQYYDEIEAAQSAFETRWKWLTNNWGTEVAERLESNGSVEIRSRGDAKVKVAPTSTSSEGELWVFQQEQSDWAGLFKPGWRRDTEDVRKEATKGDDDDEVRITLFHRLDKHQSRAITEGELVLELWHGTGSSREFMETFREILAEKAETSATVLPPSVTLSGSRGNPLTAVYDIPSEDQSDFFEAYISALSHAYTDLVLNNPEFIPQIEETFEETLESVR